MSDFCYFFDGIGINDIILFLGEKGDKGEIGLTGPIGLTGDEGLPGLKGIAGVLILTNK